MTPPDPMRNDTMAQRVCNEKNEFGYCDLPYGHGGSCAFPTVSPPAVPVAGAQEAGTTVELHVLGGASHKWHVLRCSCGEEWAIYEKPGVLALYDHDEIGATEAYHRHAYAALRATVAAQAERLAKEESHRRKLREELEACEEQNAAQAEELEKLLRFAGQALQETRNECCYDWDGGSIEEAFRACGLIEPVNVVAPCSKYCVCADAGEGGEVECLRDTAFGAKARATYLKTQEKPHAK